MLRYTLLEFPNFAGKERHFRFKLTAWLYAKLGTYNLCELRDNKTGAYLAYWA